MSAATCSSSLPRVFWWAGGESHLPPPSSSQQRLSSSCRGAKALLRAETCTERAGALHGAGSAAATRHRPSPPRCGGRSPSSRGSRGRAGPLSPRPRARSPCGRSALPGRGQRVRAAGGWGLEGVGLCPLGPPRAAHPVPPGTCEDVGQEPGDEVLLLVGQGLGPVLPDRAGGEPAGVPRSGRCLRRGPAQAGSHHHGKDEADAHHHLHGCGETERGQGAEGLRPRPGGGCSACGEG